MHLSQSVVQSLSYDVNILFLHEKRIGKGHSGSECSFIYQIIVLNRLTNTRRTGIYVWVGIRINRFTYVKTTCTRHILLWLVSLSECKIDDDCFQNYTPRFHALPNDRHTCIKNELSWWAHTRNTNELKRDMWVVQRAASPSDTIVALNIGVTKPCSNIECLLLVPLILIAKLCSIDFCDVWLIRHRGAIELLMT